MKSEDLPALYQAADTLSLEYQRKFLRAILADITFLVAAVALSVLDGVASCIPVLQALVLIGAFACSGYLASQRPDRYWYAARAVAESIKTVAWRFVARAEPFQNDDAIDNAAFRQRLRSIVEQNKDVAGQLVSHLEQPQITDAMRSRRVRDLPGRLDCYVKERISDQLGWYAKKARSNRDNSTAFFAALIVANGLAIVLAVGRVWKPIYPYWPTEMFVTLAAALLTWIQTKRFSELSASYALAAHEISLIREQSALVDSEIELSKFVGDAENAFSREHTQWVARQDT